MCTQQQSQSHQVGTTIVVEQGQGQIKQNTGTIKISKTTQT